MDRLSLCKTRKMFSFLPLTFLQCAISTKLNYILPVEIKVCTPKMHVLLSLIACGAILVHNINEISRK